MCEDECWQAVVECNSKYDGVFVYAVNSTKIYCRPSCPSRKPLRQNTVFFPKFETAEKSGFRACLRCYPNQITTPQPHLELVQQICHVLTAQLENPPTLDELAQQFNLSPYYLQRIFKQLVGVTPHQYTDEQRLQLLKSKLKSGENVANCLYEAGYSSSSSLYEKASIQLGMTPKKYQYGGKGMHITYTIITTSLGYLLVGTTENGICTVKLGDIADKLESLLYKEFYQANIQRDDFQHKNWVQTIINFIAGSEPHLDLPLDIRGTAFQKQVWQALQKIPYGETRTYKDIAREIDKPDAVRAVGTACGANPVALIVPCHRVLRSDGGLGGYEWGLERKKKLLEQESNDFRY